ARATTRPAAQPDQPAPAEAERLHLADRHPDRGRPAGHALTVDGLAGPPAPRRRGRAPRPRDEPPLAPGRGDPDEPVARPATAGRAGRRPAAGRPRGQDPTAAEAVHARGASRPDEVGR